MTVPTGIVSEFYSIIVLLKEKEKLPIKEASENEALLFL